VQQHRHALQLLAPRARVDLDAHVGLHAQAEHGELAVDTHPSGFDPLVGLAPRGQAERGHAL
jgi:hypothetical protein